MGPNNPSGMDLSIGVSTMTHTPEGMVQYTVPGMCLRLMKGYTKGMMEDEAILRTSLYHALSRLNRTHQAPPHPNWSSYKSPSEGGREATPYQRYDA
jgi:hypothetical protein